MRLTAGVLRRLSSLLAVVASTAVLLVRSVVAASLAAPFPLPAVPAAAAAPVPGQGPGHEPDPAVPVPVAVAVIGGPGPTTPAPTPPPAHTFGGTYLPATPPLCIDTPPPTGTVTPSPHKPSLVTCYTCVNVPDNEICNRYAIDRPCPPGKDFCHTLHILDSKGRSVIVNKKCADADECEHRNVGCLVIDMQTVCTSCCDEMYCNETVPGNQTTVYYNRTRARATPASAVPSAAASLTAREHLISVLGSLRIGLVVLPAFLINTSLAAFMAVTR